MASASKKSPTVKKPPAMNNTTKASAREEWSAADIAPPAERPPPTKISATEASAASESVAAKESSPATINDDDHGKTSLLSLPPELRETIYGYVFDEEISLSETLRAFLLRQSKVKKRNAGLLLTCRTIYKEALMLYYKTSTFATQNSWTIISFLEAISKEKRDSITAVYWYEYSSTSLEQRRSMLENLHEYLEENGLSLRKGVLKTNYFVGGASVMLAEEPEQYLA